MLNDVLNWIFGLMLAVGIFGLAALVLGSGVWIAAPVGLPLIATVYAESLSDDDDLLGDVSDEA